ncbi:natural killer cells antigen CD94-like isoform X2 [Artibeus jamaicensis]|uniref:natural killer cells antigen CD94-like isoform X2 n=1 Tax=Artibeus jamaicensis TaxID=9417 RepID=UPI00235ACC1C|nr:natural killer cells antigen CD94-like isoform X2 [Artibeus jamaicensis]
MAASQTTLWRLISGMLGVTALVLMAILGILMKNTFIEPDNQPTASSGPTPAPQKDSGCCSCQEKWIGYQCNCYFISSDSKPWAESKKSCASQNSTLLQLHNGNELRFMRSNTHFYWIGLSYSKERDAWLWENGSALIPDQLPVTKFSNTRNCIVYSPSGNVLDEPCTKQNYYICQQQLI